MHAKVILFPMLCMHVLKSDAIEAIHYAIKFVRSSLGSKMFKMDRGDVIYDVYNSAVCYLCGGWTQPMMTHMVLIFRTRWESLDLFNYRGSFEDDTCPACPTYVHRTHNDCFAAIKVVLPK